MKNEKAHNGMITIGSRQIAFTNNLIRQCGVCDG